MTKKPTETRCSRQHIDEYLAGELPEAAMIAVEDHLSTCQSCSSQLEAVAAPDDAWQQTQDMLSTDRFDGTCSLSSTTCLTSDSRLDCDSLSLHDDDVKHRDAVILTREIQGWLDPTDDPNMLGRFAGYEIVGIIGHGGMGIVLKGFEAALNRFVAIKVLAPRLATSGAARKRFAREAQAAAAVIHENVIAIHRVDQSHELPFLVMPYLGGVSLQKRIDIEGPLSIEATLRIGSQIAAGLSAAHAQGLVHRDIKPANILLERGVERVTITDFGLARAADDASVTRTGVIAGTPQYMSPEQARARPLDARSDLYSLGSVLYVMATARPPFRGEASFEVLEQIVNTPARPIREINASIPAWFETLVDRLHQKSADARPESANEVRQLIDTCLLHLLEPNRPLPQELAVSRPKRTVRWWLSAAIVFIAISVSVLAYQSGYLGNSVIRPSQPPSSETGLSVATELPDSESASDNSVQETDLSVTDIEIDTDLGVIEFEITTLEQELAK
jgi:serine/threonine-protein kinase